MILAHVDFNQKAMDDNEDTFKDQPNVKAV